MTLEEWEATYLPKINHLNKVDDLGDTTTLFETYGIELGYVLATADLEPSIGFCEDFFTVTGVSPDLH